MSMFLCVVSQMSRISLVTAVLQRLTEVKRSARDMTGPIHHPLLYVTIVQSGNSVSVMHFTSLKCSQTTTELWQPHTHTKTLLPEQTSLKICFYFGDSTLWSTTAAQLPLK